MVWLPATGSSIGWPRPFKYPWPWFISLWCFFRCDWPLECFCFELLYFLSTYWLAICCIYCSNMALSWDLTAAAISFM